jgi:DNA-directed RNA polymerase subunit RPC12/RpoP
MAAEDQAQKDQARGDAAVQRLPKTRRPVIQIVASGVVGTVMAAGAAGLIIDQLPRTVQLPTFICLLMVLAPTLSVTGHWFFIVRPDRITQKLYEEDIQQGNTGEADELLEQQELADDQEEDEVEEDGIRCPSCRSLEVVFDSRESDAGEVEPGVVKEDSKYNWHCDACGYQWQDDGIEE